MTRYEQITRQIDSNMTRLRAMTPGEHEFMHLSIETSELIEARGNMTIAEASEEVGA